MTAPVTYPALSGHVADLVELSHALHGRPELAYEEHFAHGLLTEFLRKQGFEVEPGACGIPTAFTARAGQGSPHIAVLCEYDAMSAIGHGCGHNVIAAAGVGAGVASAATPGGPAQRPWATSPSRACWCSRPTPDRRESDLPRQLGHCGTAEAGDVSRVVLYTYLDEKK